jgi:hypothetical protein
LREIAIEHHRQGATDALVKLGVSVGEVMLGDTSSPDIVIEGGVRLPDGVDLEQDCRLRGETMQSTLSARHQRNIAGLRDAPRWRLRLGRDLPMSLKLESGAAETHMDLSALTIIDIDLDVTAGVGTTTVVLPRAGQVHARMQAGVGALVVRVPPSMAARIRVTRGLGSLHIADRFPRTTNAYESLDYATASNRVDMRVEAGVGRIAVESVG